MTDTVLEKIQDEDVVESPLDMNIGSTAWTSMVRKKAKTLSKNIELSYMELAQLLYYVCDKRSTTPPYEPIYKMWGHKTFSNYAREELNLHERKAMSLRRIWFRLEVELQGLDPIVKQAIVGLGWTKVRELVSVLTISNAAKWAELAKNRDYSSLCVDIQKYKIELEKAINTGAGTVTSINVDLPAPEKYRHKHLSLETSQADVVDSALSLAGSLAGSTSDNHLITLICSDFIATNTIGQDESSKFRYLARLEDIFGFRLIAIDPSNNDVLYGVDTLAKVAEDPE